MVEKIIVTSISFMLFLYIFFFKLIKKNDTTYIFVLGIEALGILVNFIQILLHTLTQTFFSFIVYLFSIIIPLIVFALEYKNINVSEMIYVIISKIFILSGNNKKAKMYLINLTIKYPESYYAHKMLAEIYEKEGGMRKSIEEYVKTLEIRKNDYKSYYRISILLKDLGRDKQAILMLNNLLKVKPDHLMAAEMLSELLLKTEDYKKTIIVINKALKVHEGSEMLLYNLGIAYAKTNEFNLAKKCFNEVVQKNNNNYNAYYRLGQISLLYRDFDMAENYFLNSTYNEKEAKAYYELTKIYMIKNQKDKAQLTIEKAINADNTFYKLAKEEPIFYPIKQYIKPSNNQVKHGVKEESQKEIMIENYLNDTYNLTKHLNKDDNIKKQYEWNKTKK